MPDTAPLPEPPPTEAPPPPRGGRSLFQRLAARAPMPTRWGWYFLICSLGIFIAGSHTGRNTFVLLSCIPLAMLLVNVLAVYLNLRRIDIRRRLPGDAHAGEFIDCVLEIRGNGLLPRLALGIEDELPESAVLEEPAQLLMLLVPGLRHRVHYTAAFTRRGRQRMHWVTISTAFPFGLVRMRRKIPCRSEITIYPRPVRLARDTEEQMLSHARYFGESTAAHRGDDEVFGVREYRPGENVRRIHWRTSARLGKPMILEMEGRRDANFALILDASPVGDPATLRTRLEAAVGLCAGITYFLTREGASLRLACYGSELYAPRPGRGDRNYHAIMERLALAGLSEKPLSDWIGEVTSGGPGESLILVTLGPKETAEARLHNSRGAIVIGAGDTDFRRYLAFDPLGRRSLSNRELEASTAGSKP